MSLRRLRPGELLALAGAAMVIVSLLTPHYERSGVNLSAWDTFGPGVVLLIAAAVAGLALVAVTLAERSSALPLATAVGCLLLGLAAVVAAIVRLLGRPQHASALCAGAWLALAGALAIAAGAWWSIRDERTSLHSPISPEPRPHP